MGDEADAWMLALALGAEEDGLVEALKERFPSLEQFAERYGLATSDPGVVERYERDLRSWRETESWREHCERIGREEGREEVLASLYAKGAITVEVAAAELGVDEPGFLAICERLGEGDRTPV